MRRKIVIILINFSIGLFTAYLSLLYVRESYISTHQSNIACNIINLSLEYSSRQHPTADILYQNKKYVTKITDGDNLQVGLNDTTFFYDEMLDRVFCRNSGIRNGLYAALILFVLSFLLWINPNASKKKRI